MDLNACDELGMYFQEGNREGVQDGALEKDKYDVNSAKDESQSDPTGSFGA